jgi:hypothetical protein
MDLASLAAVAVLATVGLVAPAWDQLHRQPFFDEMWRINLIDAHDLLATAKTVPNTTAVPYGWIELHRIATAVGGHALRVVRGLDLMLVVGGLVALCAFLLFVGELRPARQPWVWKTAAVIGCALLALTPMLGDLAWYANNYLLDVLVSAALLLTSAALGRGSRAFVAHLAVMALVPLFSLSAVVFLPVALVRAFVWARARGARAVRAVLAAGAASGVVALVSYVVLYHPMVSRPESKAFLASWWHSERLQSGTGDPLLLGRSVTVLRAALLDGVITGPGPVARVLLAVLVLASATVGVVAITRRWRWFAAFLAGGWLGILAIGVATGGPVTPVRVVVGYWIIVALCATFGAALTATTAIAKLVDALGTSETARSGVVASTALLLLVLAVVWPDWSGRYPTFTVVDEIERVAQSPADHNVVLTYHYLSEPYARDRLQERAAPGRFTVVPERLGDHDRLYRPLDARFAALPHGTYLWCVVPYAIGPAAATRACRFRGAAPTPVIAYHGPDAEVLAYRR